MKKIKLLAPAFALLLEASVLFASHIPAYSTQPRGQDPKGSRKDECGCYVCGRLEAVEYADKAADCAGIVQENKCRQSLGSDQVSPEVRRSFCEQVKAKGCQTSMCDSPNGRYCGDNMPDKGGLFAAGSNAPVGKYYSEPSTGSQVIGNFPNGTRVVYNQTRVIDGQRWYYIHPPGRPAGWIPGSEVNCTRPGEPIYKPLTPAEKDLFDRIVQSRPTAAQVAGGRG
jgi:hypothetical protein